MRHLIVQSADIVEQTDRAFTALSGPAPRGTVVVTIHGDKRRFADTASRRVGRKLKGVSIQDEKQS
jgi:hypothetical protein